MEDSDSYQSDMSDIPSDLDEMMLNEKYAGSSMSLAGSMANEFMVE